MYAPRLTALSVIQKNVRHMRHMHVFTIHAIQFHYNTVVPLKQGVPPYIVFANKIVATLKRLPLEGERKENTNL